MSSKNNVNKDFYTQAGRDRPGEAVVRPSGSVAEPGFSRRGAAEPNFIPGAAPVGDTPEPHEVPAVPEAQTAAGKTGLRSGSRKKATARQEGHAPGTAHPRAGTSRTWRRRPANAARAKRGTNRASTPARKRKGGSRTSAAGRRSTARRAR